MCVPSHRKTDETTAAGLFYREPSWKSNNYPTPLQRLLKGQEMTHASIKSFSFTLRGQYYLPQFYTQNNVFPGMSISAPEGYYRLLLTEHFTHFARKKLQNEYILISFVLFLILPLLLSKHKINYSSMKGNIASAFTF